MAGELHLCAVGGGTVEEVNSSRGWSGMVVQFGSPLDVLGSLSTTTGGFVIPSWSLEAFSADG